MHGLANFKLKEKKQTKYIPPRGATTCLDTPAFTTQTEVLGIKQCNERNMVKSNKEQKFPAEHILSLNSSAGHSTLLENEEEEGEEHGSELQQSVCLSVCLSQCNVTQIENLLACRISYERFTGCKSREQALQQSAKPSAACHVFRSADFKENRGTTQSSSFRLHPPYALSLTPVYSLFLQHFTTFITQCGGSSPLLFCPQKLSRLLLLLVTDNGTRWLSRYSDQAPGWIIEFESQQVKKFIFSPNRPNWVWGPPNLPHNG